MGQEGSLLVKYLIFVTRENEHIKTAKNPFIAKA